MYTTLLVTNAFDAFALNEQITVPVHVAETLLKTHPGSLQLLATDVSVPDPGPPSGNIGQGSGVQAYPLINANGLTVSYTTSTPPPVRLIDSSGTEVWTDVQYFNRQVVLTFPAPFTGICFIG